MNIQAGDYVVFKSAKGLVKAGRAYGLAHHFGGVVLFVDKITNKEYKNDTETIMVGGYRWSMECFAKIVTKEQNPEYFL